MSGEISIRLNGEVRRVPGALTLEALLSHLGLDPARVAVERNHDVVRREGYAEVRIEDGDTLEVVRIVGGGKG